MAKKSNPSQGSNLYARHRQRVRVFSLVWTGITLLIGAFTFVSVYAATGAVAGQQEALNLRAQSQQLAAVPLQVTATPFPTLPPVQPSATAQEVQATQEPQATNTEAAPDESAPIFITATLEPIRDSSFDLGIALQKNADQNTFNAWRDMVVNQLKLNWVKIQVVWRDVEVVKGQIDWAELDVSINTMYDANTKVLLSITKAPAWARDPGAPTNQPGVFDGPPANAQDFADFLTALLNRYPGKVHAIEVWNEINLDREWTTNPKNLDPRRYVELLRVSHETIKAIDPNIIVVTAGLSPTGANIPGAVEDDFSYMARLIQAGMLDYADCVGAHHNGLNVPPDAVYNNIPFPDPAPRFRGPWNNPHHSWSFRSTLEGYRQRIVNAGKNTPICVTEFGWPSMEDLQGTPRQGFEFAYDNTLAEQADYTDLAISLMQEWGWVRLAFVWNLNYGAQVGWKVAPDDPVSDNVLWAILGPNFQQRPVWLKIEARNFRAQARVAQ